MSFAILRKDEELRLVLEDETGDGKPSVLVYRRVPESILNGITLRVGTIKVEIDGKEVEQLITDRRQWTTQQHRDFVGEICQYGYVRGEGFVVKVGDKEESLTPSAEDIIGMPRLAIALSNSIISHSLPKAGPQKLQDLLQGNSSGT